MLNIQFLLLVSIELFSSSANSCGTVTTPFTSQEQPITVSVLAVVPTIHRDGDFDLFPTWMKGEEILPAVQVAIKEISEQHNFLCGHQLEVIPVRVPMCDLNEGSLQFVASLERKYYDNILGSVGYFCHDLGHYFSQLLIHKEISAIQILAMSPPDSELLAEFQTVSYLQHSILPSSESMARAVVQVLQRLEWKRIAVVSNHKFNYILQKHEFLKVAKSYAIEVALDLYIFSSSSQNTIQELQRVGIKIVVLFLSPTEAVDILCSAYLNSLNWPHHAWILTDQMNDITELSKVTKLCPVDSRTPIFVAMNNTIFIRQKLSSESESKILPSGLNYSSYYKTYLQELEKAATEHNVTLHSNLYANVLHDSIWAFAISLNRSLSILKRKNLSLANVSYAKSEILEILGEQLSELSFHGATGLLNFSLKNSALQNIVELFQVQNSVQALIGTYNYFTVDHLSLNMNNFNDHIPTDKVSHAYVYMMYPIYLTVITSIILLLCFALTTVSMFLYIYYRKQPSIKATSTTLSISLFVGCYFMLLSSLVHTINTLTSSSEMARKASLTFRAFVCTCDLFLLNLSLDCIFATIIAKTLRVYHIFNTFGKVNRICSDRFLFVLILIIISIKVVLLVLWTCLDVNHLVFTEQYISQSVPPYILVTSKCRSNYLELWTGILFGYSSLLLLIMVILAAMTRKIDRKHFNDSKTICKLVFLLVINMCIVGSVWFIFYYTDATNARILVFNLGSMVPVILCQALLILPRIYLLIKHSYNDHFTSLKNLDGHN